VLLTTTAAAGGGWGAPLRDVPRGIKLLTSLCEGKLHLLKLPNPFPEVVGGDEQPAELALGTMSFRGELAWKHLADEASVKVRTLVECQEESSKHEQGPCPESSVACGGAFRSSGRPLSNLQWRDDTA
jgi:hypothetical protein